MSKKKNHDPLWPYPFALATKEHARDTEILNWLLQFMHIEEIGDHEVTGSVPGVVVRSEELEHALQYGVISFGDSLRGIIERAADHAKKEADDPQFQRR